jgi:hypothetical protein
MVKASRRVKRAVEPMPTCLRPKRDLLSLKLCAIQNR